MSSFKVQLAQHSTKGGIKELTIFVEDGDNVIKRIWGLRGHKMQTAEKVVQGKNIGRSNETTPNAQAIKEAIAVWERKVRQGYKAADDFDTEQEEIAIEEEVLGVGLETVFEWDPVSTAFAPSKPHNNPPKGVTFDGGYEDYFAERKNNGVNLWKVTTLKGEVDWYTRGAKKITDIVKDVTPLQDFAAVHVDPPGSIVSVEFILFEAKGREVPGKIKGIVNDRTTNEKALKRYNEFIAAGMKFEVKAFDILYWGNEFIGDQDYLSRRSLLNVAYWTTNPEYRSATFKVLTKEIIEAAYGAEWEGFVLRKLEGPESHVTYTLNGKPQRRGAWKFKFENTDDYIITAVQVGTSGRLNGKLARFALSKEDADGKLVFCCWAGPGTFSTEYLDEVFIELFGTMRSIEDIGLGEVDVPRPQVTEVKFSSKQPGSLALEHPVQLRLRPDKPCRECTLEDEPALYTGKA
jgi:hypothetical protein